MKRKFLTSVCVVLMACIVLLGDKQTLWGTRYNSYKFNSPSPPANQLSSTSAPQQVTASLTAAQCVTVNDQDPVSQDTWIRYRTDNGKKSIDSNTIATWKQTYDTTVNKSAALRMSNLKKINLIKWEELENRIQSIKTKQTNFVSSVAKLAQYLNTILTSLTQISDAQQEQSEEITNLTANIAKAKETENSMHSAYLALLRSEIENKKGWISLGEMKKATNS